MPHQPTTVELFHYMEDHDNSDIPYDEWYDEMETAVRSYNRENNTHHDEHISIRSYTQWLKEQKYPDL